MIHPICFSHRTKSNRKRRQKNLYAEKSVFSKVNHEKATIRLSQNVFARLLGKTLLIVISFIIILN